MNIEGKARVVAVIIGIGMASVTAWAILSLAYFRWCKGTALREKRFNNGLFWMTMILLLSLGMLGTLLYLYIGLFPADPFSLDSLLTWLFKGRERLFLAIGIVPVFFVPFLLVLAIGIRPEVGYAPIMLIKMCCTNSKQGRSGRGGTVE